MEKFQKSLTARKKFNEEKRYFRIIIGKFIENYQIQRARV